MSLEDNQIPPLPKIRPDLLSGGPFAGVEESNIRSAGITIIAG